jgi:integrase/ribosomal protein L37AE/L43A
MAGLTPEDSIFGNKAEPDCKSSPEKNADASPLCPQCKSKRVWRDAKRYTQLGFEIQRWSCRDCGLRFSDPNDVQKARKAATSIETVDTKPLKSKGDKVFTRQICVTETKNLAAEPKTIEVLRRNENGNADVKGKIVEYLWYMKKQGYAEATSQTYADTLEMLARKGANLNDPESVKEVIAKQNCGKGRKWNIVKAYTLFLKMQGLTWEKPKYYPVEKLPYIPIEKGIDDLIAGSSKQMATFLQLVKETGARRGEAFNLKWTDIDLATAIIRITPEKGSNPRVFAITPKLIKMLSLLPEKNEKRIWNYASVKTLEASFRKQRKSTAHKLQNPKLLQIHFHLLRHWKATTEYAKTKDILYVQKLLGHRNIKNTLRYTQLLALPQNEEYICKAAKTVEEAKELIETGFQYVTEVGETKLFRKLKTSYLGTA